MQVSNNLDTPLRLNAIRVVGAKHTRTDFLARIAAPFLSDDKDDSQRAYSDTLRGVLQKTRGFREALQKFDIFSEIEEGLESSPGVMNTDQDVDLIVKVKEGSKYFLRTATDVGDGEGSAVRSLLGDLCVSCTLLTRTAYGRLQQHGYETLSVVERHWKAMLPSEQERNLHSKFERPHLYLRIPQQPYH